jgi:hypothetical protein
MICYRTMSNAACMRSPYKYTSSQIFPTMICAASPGKQLSLIFWYKQWSAVIVKYRMVVKVFQIFPKKLDLYYCTLLAFFIWSISILAIYLASRVCQVVRLSASDTDICKANERMINQAIAWRVKSQLFFLLRKKIWTPCGTVAKSIHPPWCVPELLGLDDVSLGQCGP